jgi:hypothetical protein
MERQQGMGARTGKKAKISTEKLEGHYYREKESCMWQIILLSYPLAFLRYPQF